MISLIALPIMVGWLALSIFIARWIGKKIPKTHFRIAITLPIALLLFAAPLADEIIGKFQFDKLCKEAEEVKIYGTIPVGEDFYYRDGRWRRASSGPLLSLEESNQIEKRYKSLVREESIGPTEVSATIPIRYYEHHLFNRNTEQLLTSFRIYGTSGGWISRNFEKPVFVRDVCWPPSMGEVLDQQILPYNDRPGGKK